MVVREDTFKETLKHWNAADKMISPKTVGTLTDLVKQFGVGASYAEKADLQPWRNVSSRDTVFRCHYVLVIKLMRMSNSNSSLWWDTWGNSLCIWCVSLGEAGWVPQSSQLSDTPLTVVDLFSLCTWFCQHGKCLHCASLNIILFIYLCSFCVSRILVGV